MDQLGTVKDGAAMTRVTNKAFYGMVADGTIPADCVVRLNKRLRIDLRRLEEFLARGGTAPHARPEARPQDPEAARPAAGA